MDEELKPITFENVLTKDTDGFFRLHKSYSDLYKKTQYITPLQIIENRIVEYDIKSANISALEHSGKIDPDIIEKLRSVDKKTREVRVGKMIADNKNIGKIIKNGILFARMELFRTNHIITDEVVSIKNDAVFIAGKKLKHTDFGSFHFVRKNVYSFYMRLGRNFEFYYDGRNNQTDIKGVGTIYKEEDYQNGIMIFLNTVFRLRTRGQIQELRDYLIRFTNDYKSMKLPVQYYRELGGSNAYRSTYTVGNMEYIFGIAGEKDKPIINGIYNYKRYVLPMVQAFL